MKTEQFDVLNEEGHWTGQTKAREDVHRDGDWHRSFHLWLVKDNDYILFQRRSKHKDLEPNKIDVTVGGHFSAGETIQQVTREAEEEIGLYVCSKDIHYLETSKAERNYPNAVDREFQETYVMKSDRPLDHYHMNCQEVTVIYEMQIDKAINLYRDGGFVPANGFDCQHRINNALITTEDLIEQARKDTLKTLERIKIWLIENR